MKKGQVSVELLVVIGFIIVLFIPLIIFVYFKTAQLNADIGGMQSRLLVSKLAFISNSLGYMGDANSLKVEFLLPEGVKSLEFRSLGQGGEVLITLRDGSQVSQVTGFPFAAGKPYPGGSNYKLEFYSQGGSISVRESA